MQIIIPDTHSHNLVHSSIITVGVFDGVHKGHVQLLTELVRTAAERNTQSTVVTFTGHPRDILDKKNAPRQLTSVAERLALIEKCGVDNCLLLDFTPGLRQMDTSQFIDYVVKFITVAGVMTGFNNNIGRPGGVDIKETATRNGLMFFKGKECIVDGSPVSSSRIRDLISRGEMGIAAAMLGRTYSVSGTVEHGKRLGEALGYPTANIKPVDSHKQLPSKGVYFGTADIEGIERPPLPAMISVGENPTVSLGNITTIEAHILDLNSDYNLYGRSLTLTFNRFHRPMVKFPSLEDLKKKLALDKEECIKYFKNFGLS